MKKLIVLAALVLAACASAPATPPAKSDISAAQVVRDLMATNQAIEQWTGWFLLEESYTSAVLIFPKTGPGGESRVTPDVIYGGRRLAPAQGGPEQYAGVVFRIPEGLNRFLARIEVRLHGVFVWTSPHWRQDADCTLLVKASKAPQPEQVLLGSRKYTIYKASLRMVEDCKGADCEKCVPAASSPDT